MAGICHTAALQHRGWAHSTPALQHYSEGPLLGQDQASAHELFQSTCSRGMPRFPTGTAASDAPDAEETTNS